MALDRFSNIEEIQETNGAVRGVVWNQEDLDILQLDLKRITPEQNPTVELHLYTVGSESEYVAGGCIDDFEIDKGGRIYINYGKACQSLGIERGQFEVVINVYKDLLGSKDEQACGGFAESNCRRGQDRSPRTRQRGIEDRWAGQRFGSF